MLLIYLLALDLVLEEIINTNHSLKSYSFCVHLGMGRYACKMGPGNQVYS